MNKANAWFGFLLCFLAGMMLMWGIDKGQRRAFAIAEEVGRNNPPVWDDSGAGVPVTSKDPTWGSRSAPVTWVLYSDYECPHCKKVEDTVDALKAKYGPLELRVIWKHNPLSFHKRARPASLASETVFRLRGNDAFWKFHTTLWDHQKNLDSQSFAGWAEAVGVDRARFQAAFDTQEFAAKIDEDLASGKAVGVSGTPASFINGVLLKGSQPEAEFVRVIDEQLALAQKLIQSGTPKDQVYSKVSLENRGKPPTAPKARADEPGDDAPPQAADDDVVFRVPVGDSPTKGPATALVTIVEFGSFECQFCARTEPVIAALMKEYEGKVRLVWKHRPMPFHKRAPAAASLSLTARAEKGDAGFWAAHAMLLQNYKSLGDDDLAKYAGLLDLDVQSVSRAAAELRYQSVLDADAELADEVEATGTPHFFVNGLRLVGAQPAEKFRALIDEELKKADELVKAGVKPEDVYDKVLERAREQPALPTKLIDPAPPGTPFKGAVNADVQLHIFSDFECPHCKRVVPTLIQVEKDFGDRVTFYWRDKPLPMHKNAPLAAQAAREAQKQRGMKGFWAFHDEVFEIQGAGFGRTGFEQIAREQGLDMAAFKLALDSGAHAKVVDDESERATRAGITGTPSFVVTYSSKGEQLEGTFMSGALSYGKFRKMLTMALAGRAKR